MATTKPLEKLQEIAGTIGIDFPLDRPWHPCNWPNRAPFTLTCLSQTCAPRTPMKVNMRHYQFAIPENKGEWFCWVGQCSRCQLIYYTLRVKTPPQKGPPKE
jgi:hypothetical protein